MLVVQGQLGIRHRGRSVCRAYVCFSANEFGFGLFEVGCALLTHSYRLASDDDLWIDCAGDQFRSEADGVFAEAPVFCFSDAQLRFDTRGVSSAYDGYGSASGFVPQSVDPR